MSNLTGARYDTAALDAHETGVHDSMQEQLWSRAFLAAVPLPAAICDDTLRLAAVNSEFCATIDLPPEALIGLHIDALPGLETVKLEPVSDDLGSHIAHSGARLAYLSRAGQTKTPASITISPLNTPTGRRLQLVILHTAPPSVPRLNEPRSADYLRRPIQSLTVHDVDGNPLPLRLIRPGSTGISNYQEYIEQVVELVGDDKINSARVTFIASIDYSVFDDCNLVRKCLESLRRLPAVARQQLILMLGAPDDPRQTPRLIAALEALRPFARKLGLALRSCDESAIEIEGLNLGLLALPAEGLAEAFRIGTEPLRDFCDRARKGGIALLIHDGATQADIEFARRLPADYIHYTTDLLQLPRSRLFALSGVKDRGVHPPSLPHTAIIEATDSGIVYVDATQFDQPIVRVNPAFLAMTGYSENEVIGRNCRFLQGPATDPQAVAQIRSAIRRGEPTRCELLNYRKDGSTFWNQLVMSPVRDQDGGVIAFSGMLTDITAQREAQAAHDRLAEVLEGVADTIPGFVYQILQRSEADLEFTYLSRSAAAVLGLDGDTPPSPSDFFALTFPEDRPRLALSWRDASASLTTLDLEFAIRQPDGERRWLRSRARPIRRPKGEILWNGLSLDVTPERVAKEELTYLRDYDPLTHLPNSKKFHDQLEAHLLEARSAGHLASLYLIDFVRFHEINDTYGKAIGDVILRMIAARLHDAFPTENRFFRLQADQFAVLGDAAQSETDAREMAAAAAAVLSAPFELSGGAINLPARIGLCVDPPKDSPENLRPGALEFAQRADIALHAAKRTALPGVTLYSTDIDDRLRTNVIVKQSLRGAIDRQEFELHYQPIVQISTGRILGAEALVRWNHPVLGMQRPDTFIPIAEESGLIGPLGAWILRDALRAAERCRSTHVPSPRIAVNVSGVQISDPAFLSNVEEALVDTGVDPRLIELELTETFLINHCTETADALSALRKLGIRIAIDDFGAGYSSFHYLRHLPVDKLKVDRSFICHLQPTAHGDIAILKAMLAMARSLGLELVIEGVETALQRDLLLNIGCEIAQGYFFARPGSLKELLHRLDRQAAGAATVDSARTSQPEFRH